jgi:hypothetical protein
VTDPEPTRPDLPRLNLAGQARTRTAAPATEANRQAGQRQARTAVWPDDARAIAKRMAGRGHAGDAADSDATDPSGTRYRDGDDKLTTGWGDRAPGAAGAAGARPGGWVNRAAGARPGGWVNRAVGARPGGWVNRAVGARPGGWGDRAPAAAGGRTTGWRPVGLTGWRVPGLAGWRTPHGTLSARASLIGMFAVFLLGDLTAGSLHLAALTGFGFAAGSAAAAGWTRRQDLLAVATTPPVLFLAAVSCGELVTMHAGHVRPSAALVGADVFLTLSAAAPWLFGGLAGALVIAFVRGLPQCVRELRAELLGSIVRQ